MPKPQSGPYNKTMHHYRTTLQRYNVHLPRGACPFCDAATLANAIYEDDTVYIVPNITQYDLWEMHDVEDHLLVIPKRHVESLASMTIDEHVAVMSQAARYEQEGYNVYARGVGFVTRSVPHQHTHLIKASNKHPRAAFFLQKPYVLIKR